MPKPCTKWKKGQSGNPNGRPKGSGRKTFSTIIANLPQDLKQHQIDGHTLSTHEAVMAQLISAAFNGESWAIKDYIDHVCGKAVQAVEVEANIEQTYAELSQDEIQERILAVTERLRGVGESTEPVKPEPSTD